MTIITTLWFAVTGAFPSALNWLARRQHSKQDAPPARLAERFGQSSHARPVGPVVWFHAASLGETMEVVTIAQDLRVDLGATVLLTTSTRAGADWAAQNMPDVIHHYAPVDTPKAVTAFLNHWKPALAVFVESDLWPRLIRDAAARGIPLAFLNARQSSTRRRFPATIGKILDQFDLITCRTQQVCDEIIATGVARPSLHVTGDLKAAAPVLGANADALHHLHTVVSGRHVWVAASTHPEDEPHVLAAHQRLLAKDPTALLVLVPRHVKRGVALRAAAAALGMEAALRSGDERVSATTTVYIADTLGELGLFYRIAPVVFLGGSFGREGGHNPYEPAALGAALITGPKHRNFAEAFDVLKDAGAVLIVQDADQLADAVQSLWAAGAQAVGRKAKAVLAGQAMSVATTTALLTKLYAGHQGGQDGG